MAVPSRIFGIVVSKIPSYRFVLAEMHNARHGQRFPFTRALPLGASTASTYEEMPFNLEVGDHFSLYTDGLLEARNHAGEIYSFGRLQTLFATRPDATKATEAAVTFGQDDDITVLTLTRLATGQDSTVSHSAPSLAPA
jgi:Stage II sporulation protein E (SpoIIE)